MPEHKTKTLIALANIGTQDQRTYGIPNSDEGEFPPLEGEVFKMEENAANRAIAALSSVVEYTDEERKRLERQTADTRRKDAERMRSQAQAKLAVEQAEKDAEELARAKSGKASAKLPPAPARFESNPHMQEAEKKVK